MGEPLCLRYPTSKQALKTEVWNLIHPRALPARKIPAAHRYSYFVPSPKDEEATSIHLRI
jgi:hypothetical protein